MCAQCGCEVPKETRQDRETDREERKTAGAFTFEQPAPAVDENSREQAS